MIKLFKQVYMYVVKTVMPGPAGANRPVLILVEDSPDQDPDFPLQQIERAK